MLLTTFDSVFSPHLATFEKTIPFAGDESRLTRTRVERDMNQLEDRFADSIAKLVSTEAKKLLKGLEGAIDKENVKAVNKADWNLQVPLQQLMWGLWSEGWSLGQDHGFREVEIAVDETAKYSDRPNIIEFAKGRFDNRKAPLRKHFMKPIVEARSVWLSDNVSESIKNQIKEQITQAVLGDENGKKIGKRELYNRISEILGESGDSTKKERRGIRARAKRIARTELTAVYTLGRLEAYRLSGLVRRVQYHTFEWSPIVPGRRPCDKCGPKNGQILDLQTQWDLIINDYAIPAHGSCRCFWLPIVDDNEDDEDRANDSDRSPKPPPIAPALKWLGATVAQSGALILSKSIQDEIRRLQAIEAEKKAERKKAIVALTAGGVALSFGAIFWYFFKEAQKRGFGRVVQDAVTDQAVSATEGIAQKLLRGFKPELPTPIPAVPEGVSTSLQNIQLGLPPALVAQLESLTNLNDVSIQQLIAMGIPVAQATGMKTFIKGYLAWLKQQERPIAQLQGKPIAQVMVGSANLNSASVAELMATDMFTQKQAMAIVRYVREQPLTSLEDLLKVRYINGNPAFVKQDLNRLRLYYLRVNLNDRTLTEQQLVNRFRIKPQTARKIKAEVERGGIFKDWNDLRKRAKLSRDVIQRMQKRGGRVDDIILPDLSQARPIDLRETVSREAGIQAQPLPLSNRELRLPQPGVQPTSEIERRIENLTERINIFRSQIDSRIAKRERDRLDARIVRTETLLERSAGDLAEADRFLSEVQRQLRRIDTQILAAESSRDAGNEVSGEAASLVNQLQTIEGDVQQTGDRLRKIQVDSREAIAKTREAINAATELTNAASDVNIIRSLQEEIRSIQRSIRESAGLRRASRELDRLNRELEIAVQLLGSGGSDRIIQMNGQLESLESQGGEAQRMLQSTEGYQGAVFLVALFKERLRRINSGIGFSLSDRMIYFRRFRNSRRLQTLPTLVHLSN